MGKKVKRFVTDYLFSTPTFLSGAGSVLNIRGEYFLYHISDSEVEADAKAIRSDFQMVGQDMRDAIVQYESEIIKSK